jgi:hypothetical protein
MPTFACLAPAAVRETYVDGEGRRRQITYRRTAGGLHVVAADVDGTPFPRVWRFRDVEEARKCWHEQRRGLVCRGWERVVWN